ncbi:MAG TPA: response regulator [Candidatus Angelobacter sp.]|nr:response regulator [Candidatus Angelobacter sp.]
MSILLADDDVQLATFLSKSLESEGYSVRTALDEDTVLSEVARQSFRLIILDLNFGRTDGLRLLEKLRDSGVTTPVMVLSARNRVTDRIESLNLGADDYITKPFSFQELAARANAILRRKADPLASLLRVEDLELDPVLRKVRRGKREIKLSPKEFGLLQLLMRRAGETISRSELLQESWGTQETDSNLVDVYVNYLRKKIDVPNTQKLIHTVRGSGYRLGRPAPLGGRGPSSTKQSGIDRPPVSRRYPAATYESAPSPDMPIRALVNSVVHDLAQPLTSVRCFLEVVAMRGAGVSINPAELRSIEQQADRAIALSKGIAALVREGPEPAGPWISLELLLNEIFNDFTLVMNSGLLVLNRQWDTTIQVPSNLVLRQLLVLFVSKLVGSVTRPVVLTIAAVAHDGRCRIELHWRAADNSAVYDSRTVLAKDLPKVQELAYALGLDFVLPEGQAAILMQLPAAPLAAAAPQAVSF